MKVYNVQDFLCDITNLLETLHQNSKTKMNGSFLIQRKRKCEAGNKLIVAVVLIQLGLGFEWFFPLICF